MPRSLRRSWVPGAPPALEESLGNSDLEATGRSADPAVDRELPPAGQDRARSHGRRVRCWSPRQGEGVLSLAEKRSGEQKQTRQQTDEYTSAPTHPNDSSAPGRRLCVLPARS